MNLTQIYGQLFHVSGFRLKSVPKCYRITKNKKNLVSFVQFVFVENITKSNKNVEVFNELLKY